MAVAHVWQNLTERLVDNVVLGPRSARAALLNKKVIKKRLMEACKNEVGRWAALVVASLSDREACNMACTVR